MPALSRAQLAHEVLQAQSQGEQHAPAGVQHGLGSLITDRLVGQVLDVAKSHLGAFQEDEIEFLRKLVVFVSTEQGAILQKELGGLPFVTGVVTGLVDKVSGWSELIGAPSAPAPTADDGDPAAIAP